MLRSSILLGLLIAALGCDEARRPKPSPSGQGGPSTCNTALARRCSGATLQICRGSWQTFEDCAARQLECSTTGTTAACVATTQACAARGDCATGAPCLSASECRSRACDPGGHCVEQHCDDGMKNQDETGVDCGGSCPGCFGDDCSAPEQCITNDCRQGKCSEPSCTDGTKNGRETGSDCGGSCPGCPTGAGCLVPTDCQSGRCEGGQCALPPPSCTDGQKSGDETDIDCGGPCPPCALTKTCRGDPDCLSMFCNFGLCERPTCSDAIKNQGESDVDCGGPCPACQVGQACQLPRECGTGRCEGAVCASCSDRLRTGLEVGLDCGGPCPPCTEGTACTTGVSCASGRCEDQLCASCGDGRKSGAESDVDCGGPCPPCANGEHCSAPADCARGGCEGGLCCTLNACGSCGPTPVEVCNGVDDDCDGRIDETPDIGAPPQCPLQQGVCAGAVSRCAGSLGWICDDAAYTARSARYEAVEAACDNFDNDCDGTIDRVACGTWTDACATGLCVSGRCVQQDAPAAAACEPSQPGAYDACLLGDCWQTNAVCLCTQPGNHACVVRDTSGFVQSVDSCHCGSGTRIAFYFMMGGQLYLDMQDTPCTYCHSTEGRVACLTRQ